MEKPEEHGDWVAMVDKAVEDITAELAGEKEPPDYQIKPLHDGAKITLKPNTWRDKKSKSVSPGEEWMVHDHHAVIQSENTFARACQSVAVFRTHEIRTGRKPRAYGIHHIRNVIIDRSKT